MNQKLIVAILVLIIMISSCSSNCKIEVPSTLEDFDKNGDLAFLWVDKESAKILANLEVSSGDSNQLVKAIDSMLVSLKQSLNLSNWDDESLNYFFKLDLHILELARSETKEELAQLREKVLTHSISSYEVEKVKKFYLYFISSKGALNDIWFIEYHFYFPVWVEEFLNCNISGIYYKMLDEENYTPSSIIITDSSDFYYFEMSTALKNEIATIQLPESQSGNKIAWDYMNYFWQSFNSMLRNEGVVIFRFAS